MEPIRPNRFPHNPERCLRVFDIHGFEDKTIEKIFRISSILEKLYSIPFIKNHLALYGGTCLNFIHFRDIPRLSIDIDFNYRETDTEDWGEDRKKIDQLIKRTLNDLGYQDKAIKIQPSYPLTRFHIHYKTQERQYDSLKIEIGYLRRMPILKQDGFLSFNHPKTEAEITVKSPLSEEIFGNKFCTLLYRHNDQETISSRDLFDVYQISKIEFDEELFSSAIILDSLMREEPRLYERRASDAIQNVEIDERLKNLLRNGKVPKNMREKTKPFVNTYLDKVKKFHRDFIDEFFDKHIFDRNLFEYGHLLNDKIESHPLILWNLQNLEKQ